MTPDISVTPNGGAETLVQIMAPYQTPFDANGNVLLPGNLLPTVNGANYSRYFTQLVFNGNGCGNGASLSQIVFVPVFETCTKFVTVGDNDYFTITMLVPSANGVVAVDQYCKDAGCTDCTNGISWAMSTTCTTRSGLSSYYLPSLVGSSGAAIAMNGTGTVVGTVSMTTQTPIPTTVQSSKGEIEKAFGLLFLSSALFSVL